MDGGATHEWLDGEFLSSCLKGKENILPRVISFTTEHAVAPGNNLMSNVVRVTVEYSVENAIKHISIVVKYPPDNKEMKGSYDLCEAKEYNFYYSLVPEIRKTYNLNISPGLFISPLKSVLVLEDLKSLGYVMKDRKSLMDFDHCKFYIQALAKLHATARALYETNPRLVESMGPNMLLLLDQTEKVKVFWQFFIKSSLKCLADTLEVDASYREEYETISAVYSSIWQKIQDFLKLQTTYKTVIHGDCWTNNVMFKYDEAGNITDAKTFDMQGCSFSSAVNDLLQVIWLSSNNDVRDNRLHDLYHFYCDSLNTTLEELGCDDTLTYERLKDEVTLASPLVLYLAGCRLPVHLFDGVFDPDNIAKLIPSEGLNTYKFFHRGISYEKVFPQIIRQLAREGVFDYIKNLL